MRLKKKTVTERDEKGICDEKPERRRQTFFLYLKNKGGESPKPVILRELGSRLRLRWEFGTIQG